MEAYLDNSATTCVYQETADLVCDLMVNHYGNPSATVSYTHLTLPTKRIV